MDNEKKKTVLSTRHYSESWKEFLKNVSFGEKLRILLWPKNCQAVWGSLLANLKIKEVGYSESNIFAAADTEF